MIRDTLCLGCGERFRPRRKNHRCCSDRCRQRVSRKLRSSKTLTFAQSTRSKGFAFGARRERAWWAPDRPPLEGGGEPPPPVFVWPITVEIVGVDPADTNIATFSANPSGWVTGSNGSLMLLNYHATRGVYLQSSTLIVVGEDWDAGSGEVPQSLIVTPDKRSDVSAINITQS